MSKTYTDKQKQWIKNYRKKNPDIVRCNSYRGSTRTFIRGYATKSELLGIIELCAYYYMKRNATSESDLLNLLQNTTNEIKINGNKDILLFKINKDIINLRSKAVNERRIKRAR